MHLSVGVPLPQDLVFDIYNYSGTYGQVPVVDANLTCHYNCLIYFLGKSPNSSESTTPEDSVPATVPPPLLPIEEGQVVVKYAKPPEKDSTVETTAL